MQPDEFRAARKSLGLTQGAAASLLGVGLRAVQFWEAGRTAVPDLTARVLRAGLAHPELLEWLMGGA